MNRLTESTSLYLQQHAGNPVDWHPWDDEALAMARAEQRPILLSIGYSACHWCHVMAHESFEDPETARWMNALFLNIKVDREERPDLDRVYQLAHQLLTGRGGGWPLTVFLDPDDLTPFFAGTYFPPQPRHGLPAFAELLKKIREWFDTRRDEVREQNQRLTEAVASLQTGSDEGDPPGQEIFEAATEQLRKNYDALHGGFGSAPKFPQAPLLGLVQSIARHDASGDPSGAGHMLHDSLTRMALSGLRDHLDGGFFRYTVDGSWTIPHFEKMLYDNAMLLPLYAEVGAQANDPFLADVASGIVSWLETCMRHEQGGFAASIDADADGQEGGYHVWQRAEIESLLSSDEAGIVIPMFGLDQPPNFEGQAWHLIRADGDPLTHVPAEALRKLTSARNLRVAPTTDTKRLTTWNALCIEGLARAGMALDRPEWLDLAEETLRFTREQLWRNGRLYAVFDDNEARFPAYLDDHAGLLHATLTLLQARWSEASMKFAAQLGDALLALFEDGDRGGFFFSADGTDTPIARLRPLQDDALPGGNGVAARALLKLGHLAGDARYLDAARKTLSVARREIEGYPLAHASLVLALNDYLEPATQVIVTGTDAVRVQELALTARQAIRGPHQVNCYAIGPDSGGLPGILSHLDTDEAAAAFVCRGLECLPPVEGIEELNRLLTEAK